MIRVPIWVVVFLAVAAPTLIWAGDFLVPHVFVPGTAIKAAEVNANFEALRSEVSAFDRIVVNGGGVVKKTYDDGNGGTVNLYATRLSHPLLDNNPSAMIFVTKDITNHTQPSQGRCSTNDDFECNVYYEAGRWWIYSTCPDLKYHVLIFRGPRASPQP